MYVLYLDQLAALNLISDFFVLKLTEKICGGSFKRKNIAAALIFGLIYGIGSAFYPILSALAVKIVSGYIFYALAKGSYQVKVKDITVFFIISSFFAGAISAIYENMQSGVAVFILFFAIFYFLISYLFGNTLKSPDISDGVEKECEIVLKSGEKIGLRVLVDTGNMLKDPITGGRVLVVDRKIILPHLNIRERAAFEAVSTGAAPTELSPTEAAPVKAASYEDLSFEAETKAPAVETAPEKAMAFEVESEDAAAFEAALFEDLAAETKIPEAASIEKLLEDLFSEAEPAAAVSVGAEAASYGTLEDDRKSSEGFAHSWKKHEFSGILSPEAEDIKFRPVFYKTIDGTGQMASFRPEAVVIGGAAEKDITVAVAPGEICSRFGCSGIIGVI